MKTSIGKHCWVSVLTASAMLWISVPQADAQEPSRQTYEFSLSAQSLSDALVALSEQTGVQLIVSSELARGRQAAEVRGKLTLEDALDRILAGSGLKYRMIDARTVAIERAPSASERVLGPVRIEGRHEESFGRRGQAAGVNGINGSRDITATEGTGSYTSGALTIGSKSPQALKDVPQSLSVITAERMADQGMRDFNDVMRHTPGVTLVQQNNNLLSKFYSRGFEITTIQIDGSAPLVTADKQRGTGIEDNGYFPLIDMSQYDHVEILRGAEGLFNGYGVPSGTVNLVRKRPLDHAKASIEGRVGSWNSYRAVLDVSAPLAFDDKLRGRAVMTYQDNENFLNVATDNRTLFYGTLEYALTPSMNVSAGVSYTRQDAIPAMSGLPRYENGDDLRLPRETSFAFPWNRWDLDNTEVFAKFEQTLSERWSLKVNVTELQQRSLRKLGFVSGAVNPITLTGPTASASAYDYGSDQLTADAAVAGAIELFGQRQELVIGTNYAMSRRGNQTLYTNIWFADPNTGEAVGSVPINVFDFNPSDPRFTEPRGGRPEQIYKGGQTQYGAYLNMNLTAFDRFHLTTGLRYSRIESIVDSVAYCTYITTGCVTLGDVRNASINTYRDNNFTWPPHYSLSYDITRNLRAYGSFTDVYLSQARLLNRDLQPIGPQTGSNLEAGLKWEGREGRLNASLALYRTERRNFSVRDESSVLDVTDPVTGATTRYYVANDGTRFLSGDVVRGAENMSCCYLDDDPTRKELSQGVDFEISGEMLPRWQMSLGYTFNKNEMQGKGYGASEGFPLVSRQPRHLIKFWTDYQFAGAGWLGRLGIAGGVQAFSSAYNRGTACVEFSPPNAQGISRCAPGRNLPYEYTQEAYSVWEVRADYRVNDRWTVGLNTVNLTDKRYYQTAGTNANGNSYGAPRNYTLTLSGKF